MEISEALVAQQQVIRLQALLEASRQLHSTIELDGVLRIALEIVVRELELEGAFFSSFAPVYGDVPSEVQAALSDGAPPVQEESWLPPFMRFPLYDKTGVPFTEMMVLLPEGRTLDLDETDFLESLALQASVAIENARFHGRSLEWQRVESDLAAARQVQQSLIPQSMPEIPNYGIAGRSITCYEVGGDYLDIVPMPTGETMIVVADVAGKGLASALIGTAFRAAFRGMAHAGLSMCEIATKMNLLHYEEGEEARHRYVTALFLCLNPETHTLQVLNAGHNPAFLIAPDGTLTRFKASGTPIGMLPFSTYVTQTFAFAPGARLLAYTDGMTEVFSGDEEFGERRLLDLFTTSRDLNPDAVLTSIWNHLHAFSGDGPQSDDMTALVLTRNFPESSSDMEDTRNTVELQIPSRLGCEKIAMETAATVARQMGFSQERVEDLKTAVAEACINAIEHGNRLDDTLPIGVMLSMDDDTLEVKVSDSGKGPQIRPLVPDIDKKMVEEHSSRGMGMFLIESLMDEVEWVRCPHIGSYARMVIHLRPEDEMDPCPEC